MNALRPTTYAASLLDVQAAAARIDGWIHRTPVMTSHALDAIAQRSLFFKCENLQRIGAFKIRGATNAVRKLDDATAARGIVTHSSGNHAQAIALAAKLRGVPAHIVMPRGAAAIKKQAVLGYGARVIECEPGLEARESAAAAVVAETGGTLIPPFDHPDVIAGQGTVALELLAEVPELDAIVAPVGGGGLISGIALAVRGLAPRVRVIAGEPMGADDAARSKASGERVVQTDARTMADGLTTGLGKLTWPIVRDLVDRVITVDEDAIAAAMRLVYERMKLVIEPSSAVALAAVLSPEFDTGLGRVGIVLSGGNVDVAKLPFRG